MIEKLKLRNVVAIAICLAATIMFSACSKEDDKTIPVSAVTLSRTTDTLTVGSTLPLTPTVTPDVATNKAVTWKSSAETVATVNNGLVTAVAPGTATITVTTSEGNKTAVCTVTVVAATVPVTGVTLSKTAEELTVSDTLKLTATVLPETATNKVVTWKSSAETVATVSNGLVTAVTAGTAIITVTTDDGNKTATCTITVKNPVPQMTMTTSQTSVMVQLWGSGAVTVDWGDGTDATTDILSTTNFKNYNHPYATSSAHTITITGENITWLACSNNQLTDLNVSKNTVLEYLICSNNQLTAVDVSKNTALTELACSYNQLTILDLSANTTLTRLGCDYNQLTALDVSKNTALTNLDCVNNQLRALDVSNNTSLRFLICNQNELTNLNVNNNMVLETLNCANNQLTADALNALFISLHDNTSSGEYFISIGGNIGASTCNRNLATDKGWMVAG